MRSPTHLEITMKLIPTLLALALAPAAFAQSPLPQQGRWLTESGNLEVDIAPCGEAFCGTVVKVLANRSMGGGGELVQADARPVMGMKILSDLRLAGDGELKGEIYNRENGKSYTTLLSAAGPNQLVVRSYVGLPMFGKTQVWQRVNAIDAQGSK
jgi:uncharacterized protein (DUF2147 family)